MHDNIDQILTPDDKLRVLFQMFANDQWIIDTKTIDQMPAFLVETASLWDPDKWRFARHMDALHKRRGVSPLWTPGTGPLTRPVRRRPRSGRTALLGV